MSARRARDPEYGQTWGWTPRTGRVGGQRRSKKKRLKKKIASVWPGPTWRVTLRRMYPMVTPHSARVRLWGIRAMGSGTVGRFYGVRIIEDHHT